MRLRKVYILYWTIVILEFLSLQFNLWELHIFTNIMCAPVMFLVYYKIVKNKLNLLFLAIMILLYATDIYHIIIVPTIKNTFCIYLNSVAYLLILKMISNGIGIKSYKNLDYILVLSVLIVFTFLSYIFYVTNEIMLEQKIEYYSLFLFYCFVVFILGIVTTIKFVLKPNFSNTNLIMVFACFVFSDVFYLVSLVYSNIGVFSYFLYIPQLLVYNFLVRFELNKLKIFKI